jgi:hypothetical protein
VGTVLGGRPTHDPAGLLARATDIIDDGPRR